MSEAHDGHPRTVAILVVEDDEAVGELVHAVLSEVPGWAVTVARDATVARAAFQQVKIDVLVLDINLPGITGLELLALLREDPAWGNPSVVLMSANPQQPVIREALADGTAARFLRKPLDLDDIVEAVRSALPD
jgi:CheY-like chemotaxis protein